MKKRLFYTEAAYFLGLLFLAFGTALMERADFGLSMVVAPAYLVHLRASSFLPGFTFGMAEYCFQALLLMLLSLLMGRFKGMYLFSFVTAVLYGLTLDAMMAFVGTLEGGGIPLRLVFFTLGLGLGGLGVALLFRTYIAPEAYELFVKELSLKYRLDIGRVKTAYDLCSCLMAVVLSFAFFGFGHFEGIKAGTFVCALVNGPFIACCGRLLDRLFEFRDGLKLRTYFE